MRSIILAVLLGAVSSAQTPFEFAVVRSLVEGDPFVSVIRIELVPGSPSAGMTTLEISARAGLSLQGTGLSVFVDTMDVSGISFSGQSLFDLNLLSRPFDRVLQVLLEQARAFPSTRITHIRLDLVSYDDMNWLSLDFPLTLADSLLSGVIARDQFWTRAQVNMLEIGTATTPLLFQPPLAFEMPEVDLQETEAESVQGSSRHAWKSLLLPGWGQLAADEGLGWVNLLVEAGAIGLYASGYEEEGLSVLGVNHVVSFFDLL